jgi:hypothetical protein
MNTKKVMSIVLLITAATIFALSSVVAKPAISQTIGGGADGGAGSSSTGSSSTGSSSTGSSSTGSSSTGSSSTGSSSENYKEFQKCLSGAEKSGDVTEQQIRDCFAPIYNADGGSDDSSSDDSSSGGSSSGGSSSGGSSSGGSSSDDSGDKEE